MFHVTLTMLVAVLLQPPAPPAKEPPAPKAELPKNAQYFVEIYDEVGPPVQSHPDIRIAEARLMEAQATLDQVKRKVAIESALDKAKYDQAKADVATKTKEFERQEALQKSGTATDEGYAKASADLQTAKRQLALAESLTQAAKPTGGWVMQGQYNFDALAGSMHQPTPGTGVAAAQTQPLRDLLQRKVKLAVKATDADKSVIGVLERCIEEWDFAAAKQIVRYPYATRSASKTPPRLWAVEGENAIGVWLLMMLDEFNTQQEALPEAMRGKYQIYVREYGLLFTLAKNAPDGAPTLAEFFRLAVVLLLRHLDLRDRQRRQATHGRRLRGARRRHWPGGTGG